MVTTGSLSECGAPSGTNPKHTSCIGSSPSGSATGYCRSPRSDAAPHASAAARRAARSEGPSYTHTESVSRTMILVMICLLGLVAVDNQTLSRFSDDPRCPLYLVFGSAFFGSKIIRSGADFRPLLDGFADTG